MIFTANGSARASEIVYRAGAMVGMESLNRRPPEHIPVDFVDWPFSKLDQYDGDVGELFDVHARVVADENPKYAVAPDIDGTVGVEDALNYAEELMDLAEIVIVVPKTVRPSEVPPWYRVGIPCQQRYGPCPWKWTEYAECSSVHLLGGSPLKHREIMKYVSVVESVDTSVPVTSARFGSVWDGDGWKQGDYGFYGSLRRSYRRMRSTMNRDRETRCFRARNKKLDWEQAWREHNPDADCWGPDEEIPRRPMYPDEVPEWLPEGVL